MFHFRSPDRIRYDREYADRVILDNYEDIYAYCCRHLVHRETAEDLTQETFLKFLAGAQEYREYGKLKNYLYVIAGNLIRDYYRKKKEILVQAHAEAMEAALLDEGVEQAGERIEIRRALAGLQPLDREIIILRYYQEEKIKDISAVTGLPVSTVRYRLKKAEKQLRDRLEKGGVEEWIEN